MLLTNVRQFTDMPMVLLFSKPKDYLDTVPRYLADKYAGVQCFIYDDFRFDKSYIPSIRPYLWWQYLRHDVAREQEDYFYIDSDVIFREWPNLNLGQNRDHWLGSDCSSYIGYEYIKQTRNGPDILEHMGQICNVSQFDMQMTPGIGAHLLISKPTAEFWRKSYNRSITIWHYLDSVDSNIQKWTAEMWAQLWTMAEEGIVVDRSRELGFCMSTDPISRWNEEKILHNNGVMSSGDMFFKGNYNYKVPFGEDFSYVNKEKCSRKYVDAIERVVV